MTDALIVNMMQTPTVKRGQWVRMKKGGYKNDLAQIWNVRDLGSKIIVKLVPRTDLSSISNPVTPAFVSFSFQDSFLYGVVFLLTKQYFFLFQKKKKKKLVPHLI